VQSQPLLLYKIIRGRPGPRSAETIVFGVLENVIGFIGILIAVIVGILQARYFRHLNATTNDGWIEEAMPPVASRLGDTSS
jgi:hypothetical protein